MRPAPKARPRFLLKQGLFEGRPGVVLTPFDSNRAAGAFDVLGRPLALVWLTEDDMDGITAGFEWSGTIQYSWTQIFDTVLSNGQTAHTVANITCLSCTASISVDPVTGSIISVVTSVF